MRQEGQGVPQPTQSIALYQISLSVIKKLAEGGMGAVYLAEQYGAEGFSKTVALKVIRRELLEDDESVKMFLDEAKLVADLIHPNIVQVYHLAEYKGRYFVVMEYVHSITSREFNMRHVEKGRQIPIDLAAFIVSRVCRGLYYAHRKTDRKGRHLGIVHRDVTPTNVLIDFRGNVKLSDFGIAKALTMRIPDEKKIIMGKLPYLSPEQARGQGTDHRSDIYSLGLCLHELLTGVPVFMPRDRSELMALQELGVPSVRDDRPTVPQELDEIIQRATAYRVKDRLKDANEFLVVLETYMYRDRYGPTNEKLAEYTRQQFPEIHWDRVE